MSKLLLRGIESRGELHKIEGARYIDEISMVSLLPLLGCCAFCCDNPEFYNR